MNKTDLQQLVESQGFEWSGTGDWLDELPDEFGLMLSFDSGSDPELLLPGDEESMQAYLRLCRHRGYYFYWYFCEIGKILSLGKDAGIGFLCRSMRDTVVAMQLVEEARLPKRLARTMATWLLRKSLWMLADERPDRQDQVKALLESYDQIDDPE